MARIQTLGLAAIPAPKRAAAPAAASMEEMGATGTPIFSGLLADAGEYNPDFSAGPFSSFRIFEKMRRQDAQVAATLSAIKLPIRSAEWRVVAPDDATPAEKEASEFVEDCLIEDIDFDQAISNALLMLDFGVAAHEDVWTSDGGRVTLARLAPRLPMTFYQWEQKPGTEELAALVQQAYRGATYATPRVPVEKLALFTYDQEGANYAGRSLLRPMYQHWYIKSNLYTVDAIACERNGMGVPVGTLGPNANAEDRRVLQGFLQRLTAHESAYLMLPNGYTFDLKGVTGQVRDCKESIAHHNTMISMAGLAMFMMLGQSDSGSRALGDTMADFFFMGLQAAAKRVCRGFNMATVKRLAEYNFGSAVRAPKLVAQKILSIKFQAVVDSLQKLAQAGVVNPDPDLEKWVRQQAGAPEAAPAKVTRAVEKVVVPVDGLKPAAGGAAEGAAAGAEKQPLPDGRGSSSGRGSSVDGAAAEEKVSGARANGAGGVIAAGPDFSPAVPDGQAGKPVLRRAAGTKGSEAFRRAEQTLSCAAMIAELDRGRDEVAAALRMARSRVQAEIVQKIMGRPVAEAHRVSLALDEKLAAAVEAVLRQVYEFGSGQVAEERARQAAGGQTENAAAIRAAAKAKRDPLGIYADAVVSEFENTLTARAANVALDWRRRQGDLTDGEVIRKIEGELDEQSDKWVDSVASKGTNEAFADGRSAGYEEFAGEVTKVVYSALLDVMTCGNCEAADGEEGNTPEEITAAPNPDCDGGDRCRCVHVYVFGEGE